MNIRAIITATLVSGSLLVATPAQASDLTRILVVGDSVTHGSDGDYTWRYFTGKGLQQSGAAVDFVGPHVGTQAEARGLFAGGYADPNFDQDHAAQWGMAMWEMLNTPSETTPTMTGLVSTYSPDVIVETLGYNDLVRMDLEAGEVAAEVGALVTEARGVKPDVDVVLGSIPQVWAGDAVAYNALLPDLAAALSTPESRVVAAPVPDFTNGVDTYDPAHPTTSGQVKIAAAISAALAELGVGDVVTMAPPVTQDDGPAPAPIESAPVTTSSPVVTTRVPAKPQHVQAERKSKRTRVLWKAAIGAERYEVRCNGARRTVSRTKVTVRGEACRVRAVNAAGVSAWVKARNRR